MTTNTIIQGQEKELKTVFASEKSFYGKAITRTDENENGKYHSLFSYGTFIIELKEFENGEIIINAMTDNEKHLTVTTLRHLREFAMQHDIGWKSKKEWLEIQSNTINNDY